MAAAYFDHNATTPVDPRVGREMTQWLGALHGNPSSIHAFGQRAREAVEGAREEVGRLLNAAPPEIVFTASGTEANNTVLRAIAERRGFRGHLVVSAVEHPSVEATAKGLEAVGMEVSWVRPDSQGSIDAEAMIEAVREDTCLVCLVLANNVIGTLQPVAQVASACRQVGVPVLCDAVQALGKISVHVDELGVDYLTLGAHKFYGPLGAAALWIAKGAELVPLLLGGSQERRRRAGTENVPAIVGMGKAAELARLELQDRQRRVEDLRRRFETGLQTIPDVVIHGAKAERLGNTSHVAFLGVDNQSLLIRLDLAGFAVSAGAACSSGTVEPSSTLLAMDVPREEALSAIRVSLGNSNSAAEVDSFLVALRHQVGELRRLAVVTL